MKKWYFSWFYWMLVFRDRLGCERRVRTGWVHCDGFATCTDNMDLKFRVFIGALNKPPLSGHCKQNIKIREAENIVLTRSKNPIRNSKTYNCCGSGSNFRANLKVVTLLTRSKNLWRGFWLTKFLRKVEKSMVKKPVGPLKIS